MKFLSTTAAPKAELCSESSNALNKVLLKIDEALMSKYSFDHPMYTSHQNCKYWKLDSLAEMIREISPVI